MAEEKQPLNDHDLLIRLDTRFEDFSTNHAKMWGTFTELVHKFMTAIDNKADRHELEELKKKHDKTDELVQAHDTAFKVNEGKKQTVIQVGELGLKFWGALAALVTFVIALVKAIK